MAATKTEIQQAQINLVTEKATGEKFYTVKSDSTPNTYYQIRWNEQALAWQCNCPARKPCKHERAVQEVTRARRLETSAKGTLNGNPEHKMEVAPSGRAVWMR